MVTLSQSELSLSDAEYLAFSQLIDGTIPPEFKSFIMNNNGGVSDSTHYENEEGTEFFIHQFFSAIHGELKIEAMMEDVSALNHSATLMPFAKDNGTNSYCIDLDSALRGKVFKVYIDGSDSNPVYVAPSFKAFVDGLVEYEEDEFLI